MNTAVWDAIASSGSKAAIHCPTEELANNVVAVVKKMTGRGFIDDNCRYWESYKSDTCYYPNVGCRRTMQYSDIRWAELLSPATFVLHNREGGPVLPTVSIKGKQFGLLKAVSFAGYFAPNLGSGRVAYWTCKCKCGAVIRVRADSLRSGRTKSCGCLRNKGSKLIDVAETMTKS